MRIFCSRFWTRPLPESDFNVKLTHHQYGKARVRVMKVFRNGNQHSLKELDVSVLLQGDFDSSYTGGDNRLVVPTDTMKNTVNVFAKERLGAENEEFGLVLSGHFLKTYPQVRCAEITLSEHGWSPISVGGKPHDHSFTEKNGGRPIVKITGTKSERRVESGIEDLLILKTTGSGFEGYVKDRFTTLPETSDRVFATRLKANWSYERTPKSYSETNGEILDAMLEVFSVNYSPSVQATLFQMGEAALQIAPEISKIHLVMPNKHCLLVNLAPFGVENKNELFVPTGEPHGQIEGTVARS
jgi:urate oxidase